jgi:hypothetical protein
LLCLNRREGKKCSGVFKTGGWEHERITQDNRLGECYLDIFEQEAYLKQDVVQETVRLQG